MTSDFDAIIDALLSYNNDKLLTLVDEALANNISASDILNDGLIAGMDIVGERMQSGEIFIPEVLMTAHSMGKCVEILKPLLGEDDSKARASVLIGTVQGDLHDIGKNLVAMMLESAGMEVYDLGVDISPENFISEIKNKKPQFVCLSALLTTTIPKLKDTIDGIVESGLRDSVKILVGGAPVTQSYADTIGADGYAPDAGTASKLVKSLIQ